MTQPDLEQREFWDRRAEAWERRADSLDAFSDVYGTPVMDALGVVPGERIVDVGCGPGTTSIELAKRVTPDGEVVGVDISPEMVAAATRRATKAGVTNARFEVADAQSESLGDVFDAAYSRFGVMFFSDPVAAFTNLGRSVRAGGRLGCAVWGPLTDNPWMFVPTLAAADILKAELALPGPDEPGPFSLSDPTRIREVLGVAGFVDVEVELVEGSRLISSGQAAGDITMLLEVGPLGEAYQAADEPTRRQAIDAVLGAIDSFKDSGGDGWRLPGSALQVIGRRP